MSVATTGRRRKPATALRRAWLRFAFFLLVVAAAPSDGAAQTRADSAAVLLNAAMRFGNEGRGEIAEALYEMILQRFGDTASAERVRQLRAGAPGANRAGRTELQVWGTMYGAWAGIAVPLMLDADGPEPYGLGLLLGAPAGFLVSRTYSRTRPLSEGQARAITLGGTWGTWQGFGWAEVFDLGVTTERFCPDPAFPCFEAETGDATQERVAAALAGGIAGILTGALISRKPISPGLAATVNYGALWGSWFGLAGGLLADLEDDDLLASTLIGGNAGLLATAILGPQWRLSRNRARLISLGGLVGGLAGGGIDLLLRVDDEKTAIAIPLITSIAGLALAVHASRNFDGGGGDGGTGALLERRHGRWTLDMPPVLPALQRNTEEGRIGIGVYVPLLRSAF